MIPLLLLIALLILVVSSLIYFHIQSDINIIDSELTACELADIIQDDSEEDDEVKFSINSLINQTLKERKN